MHPRHWNTLAHSRHSRKVSSYSYYSAVVADRTKSPVPARPLINCGLGVVASSHQVSVPRLSKGDNSTYCPVWPLGGLNEVTDVKYVAQGQAHGNCLTHLVALSDIMWALHCPPRLSPGSGPCCLPSRGSYVLPDTVVPP